jgi:hypothetical protein
LVLVMFVVLGGVLGVVCEHAAVGVGGCAAG